MKSLFETFADLTRPETHSTEVNDLMFITEINNHQNLGFDEVQCSQLANQLTELITGEKQCTFCGYDEKEFEMYHGDEMCVSCADKFRSGIEQF